MAPPSSGSYGTINIEFWDISGDMKYEKCWGPMMKDADGIMFVIDPAAPQGEEQLSGFHRAFLVQMNMRPEQAFLFVNHHNKGGSR